LNDGKSSNIGNTAQFEWWKVFKHWQYSTVWMMKLLCTVWMMKLLCSHISSNNPYLHYVAGMTYLHSTVSTYVYALHKSCSKEILHVHHACSDFIFIEHDNCKQTLSFIQQTLKYPVTDPHISD